MNKRDILNRSGFRTFLTLGLLLLATTAFASASGLPWEGPLNKILNSVTGPLARFLGAMAILVAGFGIAFGEAGSGMRRLFQVVLGLSIAFTAVSLLPYLGYSGGVAF